MTRFRIHTPLDPPECERRLRGLLSYPPALLRTRDTAFIGRVDATRFQFWQFRGFWYPQVVCFGSIRPDPTGTIVHGSIRLPWHELLFGAFSLGFLLAMGVLSIRGGRFEPLMGASVLCVFVILLGLARIGGVRERPQYLAFLRAALDGRIIS